MSKSTVLRGFAVAAAAMVLAGAAAAAPKVAVITPYLAQPGTQFYVEGFQAAAKAKGWDVNLIDTKGDVAAVISRIEDVVTQKVDAIVINVDPAQVKAGLQAAKGAKIPVFGMDAGSDPLLVTNVTSNGYAMAAETAVYVANRIGGAGNVVMFVFDAFPPVQVRGHIADAVFSNFPDIKVLDRVTPDVKDGGIADSRAKMEAILAANPEPGSIKAVWAAWDQPALGALQAIEGAGARRGHRHHRHRRQPAGARGDRRRRQFRGLDRPGFPGHRRDHRRRRRPHPRRRDDQAGRDVRADQADHQGQRKVGWAKARQRRAHASCRQTHR